MNSVQDFSVDKLNEPTLRQLYHYFIRSPDFCGDLNKGIMLQGKYGCGKTILMRRYAHLQNHFITRWELRYPIMSFMTSMEIVGTVKADGVKPLSRRELVIDEFGREPKSITDFGNVIRPMAELISLRAECGAVTHATSNFSLENLRSEERRVGKEC